ncbi:MAG: helix-turn-helix transcriptional regulator [Balneolales bacterium]|nr:helix-turn-helix transcriptional regulator [Balneolales bacterium]
MARFAKALGHPARIAIMAHLSQAGGCCAGELQLNMPLAQSTVSQHMKVLCGAASRLALPAKPTTS